LSGRADLDTGARAAAGTLRSQTVGLLNRARAAIADDVAQNEKLPRDLDGQIFGYLDELEERREAAARAAKAASKKAEAKKAEEAKPANAPEAPKPPAAPEK
jgi:F0F1-type ATP synthase membrane subunit b/b'